MFLQLSKILASFCLSSTGGIENHEKDSKSWIDFINSEKVIVQGIGAHYRNQTYQNERKGFCLFEEDSPSGALIQEIENGKIDPNDVIVLFDVDDTLITDCTEEEKNQNKDLLHNIKDQKLKQILKQYNLRARGDHDQGQYNNNDIKTTKNTMKIIEHLKNKKIPFGFLTFRDCEKKKENVYKDIWIMQCLQDDPNISYADFIIHCKNAFGTYTTKDHINIGSFLESPEFKKLNLASSNDVEVIENIIATNKKAKSSGFSLLFNKLQGKYIIFADDSPATLREIQEGIENGETSPLYKQLPPPAWIQSLHQKAQEKDSNKVILINYAKGERDDYVKNPPFFDSNNQYADVICLKNHNSVSISIKNLLEKQEEKRKNSFFKNTKRSEERERSREKNHSDHSNTRKDEVEESDNERS